MLAPGGALVLECHEEHAAEVADALPALGYAEATIAPDLAGRDRVVEARWKPTRSSGDRGVRAGKPVLLPTDGVYGLCASALREAPVRRLYELKGRAAAQPTAMIASSVEMLLEARAGAPRPRRARSCARCCPGRARSCSRTRRAGIRG